MAKTAGDYVKDLTTREAYFVLGWLTSKIEIKGLARTKDVREAVEAARRAYPDAR